MYEFRNDLWSIYDVSLDRCAENERRIEVSRIDGDTAARTPPQAATTSRAAACAATGGAHRLTGRLRPDTPTRDLADSPPSTF